MTAERLQQPSPTAEQLARRAAAVRALAVAEGRAGRSVDGSVTVDRRAPRSVDDRAPRSVDQSATAEDGAMRVLEGRSDGPGAHPGRGSRAAAGRRASRTRRGGAAVADAAAPPPPPPDLVAEDREPDPEDVARAIVLKQLAMAPRSRQQLADKLRQRGCPEDVGTRVLDRMEAVGLVDDEAYAQLVVRSKQATRGLAKRALAHELRGKGVADTTIADALGSIDAESERALAEEVAGKAMRRLAGLDPQVQARRLAGVLGRKGYPPSVVYAVVRDAVNDAPEHQRD